MLALRNNEKWSLQSFITVGMPGRIGGQAPSSGRSRKGSRSERTLASQAKMKAIWRADWLYI